MSPQAGWILQEEIVPRLRSAIPKCVRCVGAEDHEELVQDATATAAKMLHNLEIRGKQVTPGNVAYYTIQHAKSGRRSTGSSRVDVMGSTTQLNGSTILHSFSEVVAGDDGQGEPLALQDVISNDREDPATVAARKMDWDRFLDQLSRVERIVVEFLSAGKTLREAGRKVGVSDGTMQAYRKKIAAKALEFMGADVLRDLGHLPSWRIDLECEHQAQACRNDRRAQAA